MSDKRKQDNPLRAVALTGALGLDVSICMLLGYWGGVWLHDLFGGKGWVVVGLLCGLAVGLYSAVILVKKFLLEDANG